MASVNAVAMEVDQRAEGVTMVPISRVSPAADNPRQQLGDLGELIDSIKAQGILQPLVVTEDLIRPRPGESSYTVVIGHRRLGAAKALGLAHVPCIVRVYDDRARQEAMLVENLQRVDLTALEEASAFNRLVDLGLSQRDVAARVGRSQAHISKRMSLLQLPPKVQQQIGNGKINVVDALELTKLAAHPERLKEAVERGGHHYQGYAGMVAEQLRAQARTEAREATRADLQSRGIKIVLDKESHLSFYGEKVRPLAGQGRDYEALKVTVAKHQGEPCHAAAIDGDGKAIYVCTDLKRHPADPTAKEQDDRSAQRRRELRKNKLAKLEADARAQTAAIILAGANLEGHLPLIASELAKSTRSDEGRIACQFLRLEVRSGRYGSPDFAATLVAHATISKKQAWQVLLAIAFAQTEGRLRNQWHNPGDGDGPYLELLAEAGYVKPKLPPAGKAASTKSRRAISPESRASA